MGIKSEECHSCRWVITNLGCKGSAVGFVPFRYKMQSGRHTEYNMKEHCRSLNMSAIVFEDFGSIEEMVQKLSA